MESKKESERSTIWAAVEDTIGPDGRDLLQGMLQFDPDKRLTITQILEHPYCNL